MRHCAWKDLACCTSPASIRRLNLFAAACPFNGIGPYTAKAALILMPNTAGSFLTSPANQLGLAPCGNGDRNQPNGTAGEILDQDSLDRGTSCMVRDMVQAPRRRAAHTRRCRGKCQRWSCPSCSRARCRWSACSRRYCPHAKPCPCPTPAARCARSSPPGSVPTLRASATSASSPRLSNPRRYSGLRYAESCCQHTPT